MYTSNVFAIMGLRSMYFALVGMMTAFTTCIMDRRSSSIGRGEDGGSSNFYHIPIGVTLAVVAGIFRRYRSVARSSSEETVSLPLREKDPVMLAWLFAGR